MDKILAYLAEIEQRTNRIELAQLTQSDETAMSTNARGSKALQNCKETVFADGRGEALFTTEEANEAQKVESELDLMIKFVFPALERATNVAWKDTYPDAGEENGLIVVDSQTAPWLPQGNDIRQSDRKPDGLLMSRFLFEQCGESGKPNAGKPALRYRLLHQV